MVVGAEQPAMQEYFAKPILLTPLIIKGILSDFIHQTGGGSPVFMREDFVNTCLDISLWLGLIEPIASLKILK
jgi:hypothetical protein